MSMPHSAPNTLLRSVFRHPLPPPPKKKNTPKPQLQKGAVSIKVLESLTNLAPLRSWEHRIQVPLVRAFHDPVRNRWERLPEVGVHGWLVAEGPRL